MQEMLLKGNNKRYYTSIFGFTLPVGVSVYIHHKKMKVPIVFTPDFITIRALQERYGTTEPHRAKPNNYHPSPKADAIYVNEIDFETFVQQFPIDDSIAECFASSSDTALKPETKFVSVSTQY